MFKKINLLFSLILILNLLTFTNQQCVHDHFAHSTQKHFYNDLQQVRMLQTATAGRLRIFADYTQVSLGGPSQINTIKRIINITASYFYLTLNVTRLDRLFFPSNTSKICSQLTVPDNYITTGTIGDVGVLVGNQQKAEAVYVAKATACAFLASNKRPIWGMIMFNNAFLKFDQVGFQQNLFVGMHEMTHILGFSASMYSMYPSGNPLKQQQNGDNYLNSEPLRRQAQNHFGCESPKGILLQDQDGTLIGSHWQRKLVGAEYMIASGKVGSFISRFTLALLQSTGWYTSVNYTLAEPTTWGRNKGCSFFNIDNCDSSQFCPGTDFDCDWQGNSIGRCSVDLFTGSCKTIKYFTNTVCVDENYQLRNLNSKMNALQRGGSSSKCFRSNFRQTGLTANALNNRCYITVCSATGRFIFILVGQAILICRIPGQRIAAPVGLQGTLTCPGDLNNYCRTKTNCPYHCNKNGACLNGQCLCTGAQQLTPSCLDMSIYQAPIGSTGGFLLSLRQDRGQLIITNDGVISPDPVGAPIIVKYSIDKKCMTGSVYDNIFGQCLLCKEVFNCLNCDQTGCFRCDNGTAPISGKCYV